MKSVKINQEIINEIVRRIASVVVPEKIILFGSYVYGLPDENSDIDILVIKSEIESRIKEYAKARKSLKGIRYPFDIIIITPEEFKFYSENWHNSVIAEAKEKGNIIYERKTRT